jgi:ribosomal 30S subunit maturation factor RimM
LGVQTPTGEVLIPMVKQIIVSVDIGAKLIVVNPPEGLLDVKN